MLSINRIARICSTRFEVIESTEEEGERKERKGINFSRMMAISLEERRVIGARYRDIQPLDNDERGASNTPFLPLMQIAATVEILSIETLSSPLFEFPEKEK